MPLFFIQSQSIQNDAIVLPGELAHHLRDVLRCRPGEIVHLVDENRGRYRTVLDRVTKEQVVAKILNKEAPATRPAFSISLAQAVLKGEKMDWMIQKATELGADRIIPIVTERTIVRPRAERESHRRDRWQKIAKEAAQQCGRTDIPVIQPTLSLEELCDNPPAAAHKLVLWEQEQDRSLRSALTDLKNSLLVLIGPEGGFPLSEIEKLRKAGWISVSLGRRILRAETAGLALLAILEYELNETR
jgi:16S rRNA (uracil1498-N3)-methyltransferase